MEQTGVTRRPGRKRIGVLTSGGDAQGMNAAVRAVVRGGIHFGADVYAIYEGYEGMVAGGDGIRQLGWDDVSGILHRGGTVIGTARSVDFREREGRRRAAVNLVRHGIDRLVVIGGDGSLTGADALAQEWPGLLADSVAAGDLEQAAADAHPALMIAGLVGSIDNDMVGTDMTIGADSALHRITEAIDAIASTAASHQRVFVVEVMGRRCGYLAMAAAIAGGADYALIPENPPEPGWEDRMCQALQRGRSLGRRESIVLVAEGARDRSGAEITTDTVKDALKEHMGADARVTILGHVQRGGTPSAFDRSMATMMGYAAVEELLAATPETEAQLIGLRRNRVYRGPLMRSVRRNQEIASMVDTGRYDEAMKARGESFGELHRILKALAEPTPTPVSGEPKRIGILHAGGLAPGMNTVVRSAVRIGHDAGHVMLGIEGGFKGLRHDQVRELALSDVEGWAALGGAELGSRRGVVEPEHLYPISRAIETHRVDALLVVGGFDAYENVHALIQERDKFPALRIPIVCLPASIDNNLPGTELSVGSDTALNNIVESVDRVKQSAMAARRCFVVETMGRNCGYLGLMSALSSGAEQMYIPEEGISLSGLAYDVSRMRARFAEGRRLFVAVRCEGADEHYTTDVVAKLFEAEGQGVFDVRQVVLGHTQQGGNPSPFDRILATRLAFRAIEELTRQLGASRSDAQMIGLLKGQLTHTPVAAMDELIDWEERRPVDQWWVKLNRIVRDLADPPGPA
ncbi:6-phosphofructokinase [Actinomycetota bacterium]